MIWQGKSTRIFPTSLVFILPADEGMCHGRGAFCCACPVNFSLMRETAGMQLRR